MAFELWWKPAESIKYTRIEPSGISGIIYLCHQNCLVDFSYATMGEGSDRPSTRFPSTVTHTSSSVEHTIVPFPVPLLYMKKKICRGGVQGSGRLSIETPYVCSSGMILLSTEIRLNVKLCGRLSASCFWNWTRCWWVSASRNTTTLNSEGPLQHPITTDCVWISVNQELSKILQCRAHKQLLAFRLHDWTPESFFPFSSCQKKFRRRKTKMRTYNLGNCMVQVQYHRDDGDKLGTLVLAVKYVDRTTSINRLIYHKMIATFYCGKKLSVYVWNRSIIITIWLQYGN